MFSFKSTPGDLVTHTGDQEIQFVSRRVGIGNSELLKLYFPLAEEWNKWKMFSHTPLGPGPKGLFFESHAQCCLSVAVLLSTIADMYF